MQSATLSLSLGSATVVVPQDGATVQVPVTIAGPTGTASVAVSGLPVGVTGQFAVANGGPSGTLTFTGSTSAAAGSYAPIVTASLAGQTATANLSLVSAVVAKVSNATDTTLGVKGTLKQFMSTSFQIAEWTGDLFGTGAMATAREATLTTLAPQHIRIQALSKAIPMKANTGQPSDWDFTMLDQTVQPVLASADHSPEFQIAVAPAWMCDSSGHLDVANHLKDFAAYAANLVRYYNTGGFNVGGTHFQSLSSQSIAWWGIFNEYNINGLTTAQYATLYNAVVPAMLAVDPTIKFSALEFFDNGLGAGGTGDPMLALPTFLAAANAGGVKAQVDIVSTHFYGTCNHLDTDATVFNVVPQFAANVNYFYQQLKTRSDLASVPVWGDGKQCERRLQRQWHEQLQSDADFCGRPARHQRFLCRLAALCVFAAWQGGQPGALSLVLYGGSAIRRSGQQRQSLSRLLGRPDAGEFLSFDGVRAWAGDSRGEFHGYRIGGDAGDQERRWLGRGDAGGPRGPCGERQQWSGRPENGGRRSFQLWQLLRSQPDQHQLDHQRHQWCGWRGRHSPQPA